MIIYHAKQSGFVVLAEGKFTLLFDVITPRNEIPESLFIDSTCLPFVSHRHHDHWRSKLICEFPTADFFISNDVVVPLLANITTMAPNQSAGSKGLSVSTYGSTDQGVSFIATLPDNRTILHCGDLNWWHWASFSPEKQAEEAVDFKSIINKMSDVDITYAFVPVDPRLGDAANWAAQYIIDTLHPTYLIPMHFFDRYEEVNIALDGLIYNDTQVIRVNAEKSFIFNDTQA
jgi:L-ascorbate metabolism protein UlaG (beta-lactamase superfamily)